MLVGEVVLEYLNHAHQYYKHGDGSPTGEAALIKCLLRPLVQRYAELPTDSFGPRKLKQLREDMIARGWSRYTINKSVAITKRCFNWCASEELIPPEIAMALKTVAGLRKNRTAAKELPPVGPVPDAVIERTLPLVSDLVRAVCQVALLTGARVGEVLTMSSSEIDRSDPSCWVYTPARHKCSYRGDTRVVHIGAQAQAILLPWIVKSAPEAKLFNITRAALRRSISRACRRAGVPNWHPSQLRHNRATYVRAIYGLEAASAILGHSNVETTQVYAERNLEISRAIAQQTG
jgi:integrase